MFDIEDNTFLLAGPVKMHPRVLRAAGSQAVAHRSPEFSEVNGEIASRFQGLLGTENAVAILTGSGTLAMDAVAQSLLQRGDRVVALSNGKFGERMAELATLYGDATVLAAPWGQGPDLGAVEDALAAGDTKALFLTHNETSTGLLNPLPEIAELAHEHGALVVADCITSVGGLDVPVDDWGVDVCIVGSQKCLGAPSGLALVAVSPEAEAAMDPDRGYYLNLRRHLDRLRKDHQTPFTPAIPLHLALLEALRILDEEGKANRFARVADQAHRVRGAVEAMGLELFPDPALASPTVTAVRYPEGVSDKAVRERLKQELGVVVAGAQGPIKGKVFRIGHMGTVDLPELAGGLAALERVLVAEGAPVKPGAWAGALLEDR